VTSESQQIEGDIELVLPADTKLVRLARLVASGIAATGGFDVEEIEDVRIAVDEGCAALIEGGDGSPLRLSFALQPTGLVVEGRTPAGSDDVAPERLTLSDQILAVVVDDHEVRLDGGNATFSIRKRRAQPVGGAATS
jgi:serine/threonine-protein kinase RsbW